MEKLGFNDRYVNFDSLAEGIQHGPYRSVQDENCEAHQWLDLYLAPEQWEYATNKAEALELFESRWQADQHTEAISDASQAGVISPDQANFLIDQMHSWYFWPLLPEKQLKLSEQLNQRVTALQARQRARRNIQQ